jgi:hypothetical protein
MDTLTTRITVPIAIIAVGFVLLSHPLLAVGFIFGAAAAIVVAQRLGRLR